MGAPQIRDAITDTVGRDPDLGCRAGCAETGGADRVGAGCAVVAVSVGGLPVGDGVVRCVLPKVWSGGDIEGYGNARLRNAIGGDHGDDSVRGTNNVRGRGRRQDATQATAEFNKLRTEKLNHDTELLRDLFLKTLSGQE